MGLSVTDGQEPTDPEYLPDQPLDENDQELLDELRRVLDAVDPVPPGLVERIGFTLTLAHLEMDLAKIVSDSLEPAGARGEERSRTVTFTADSLAVMVTITPMGGGRHRFDGWLAPGGRMHVELRLQQGTTDTHADDDGRFEFNRVPAGLAQFVFHPTEGGEARLLTPVVTPAIEV